MTSSTVFGMDPAGPLNGAELIYGVQGGVSSKITATQVAQYIDGQLSGDLTSNSSGVVTVTKTGGTPLGTLATAATPLAINLGGSGSIAPSLVAGTNISITGSWPNQTIASTASQSLSLLAHGGRLTVTAGTPVIVGQGVANQPTLYYAPYANTALPGYVAIYNGTSLANYQFTSGPTDTVGLSLGTWGSGWAVSSVYDVFVTLVLGVPVLCTGPVWPTINTRPATGYPVLYAGQYANGTSMTARISNSSTITVPPYQATYLGTVATDAAGQLDFYYGGVGSGGVAGYLNVWNYYNRVGIATYVFDTGAPYTYTTAAFRLARNSTGNRIFFVVGMIEDQCSSWYQSFITPVAVAGAYTITSIGFNTTSVSTSAGVVYSSGAAVTMAASAWWTFTANPIGLNYMSALEEGDGSHANSISVFGGNQMSFEYPM